MAEFKESHLLNITTVNITYLVINRFFCNLIKLGKVYFGFNRWAAGVGLPRGRNDSDAVLLFLQFFPVNMIIFRQIHGARLRLAHIVLHKQ